MQFTRSSVFCAQMRTVIFRILLLGEVPGAHTSVIKAPELTLLCKENIIYIRVEFTRTNCKTAILLYCFHTAGVLHIFVLYNLLGPGTSFYRKSKINIKRNEICWFHI